MDGTYSIVSDGRDTGFRTNNKSEAINRAKAFSDANGRETMVIRTSATEKVEEWNSSDGFVVRLYRGV